MSAEQYLLHRDCRELDPTSLGHTSVNTDPPYAPHVHESMTSCAQAGDVKGVRHRDAGFDPLGQDLLEYVAAAANAAARWSAIYTDVESVGAWRDALGGRRKRGERGYVRALPAPELGEVEVSGPVGELPWIRWSSPQQSGDRPPSGCEMVVLAHGAGKMTWRGPGNLTSLEHKCKRGDAKHPTEKPLDQALDLVSWFTEPGELVYEPTAGYATVGVACALLGRDYVGCQHHGDSTDPEVQAEARRWFELGVTRLSEARAGRLNPGDQERLGRWLSSVLSRTGLRVEDAADLAKRCEVPMGFKKLVKGKLA